jgi:citrate lyase subunit beta/citryl-CoA lyase
MDLTMIAPLFVPASRPDLFDKAAASGADAVILDLEDAVAAADKIPARSHLRKMKDVATLVRINAIGTPWHDDDIAAVMRLMPVAVMVPKCEAGTSLDSLLARLKMPVIALVETGRGIATARAVSACDGISQLAFGSVDYCADLGCAHVRSSLLVARSELVLASRLAGLVPPLDGVTLATSDNEAVASDARYAQSLGFGGKLAIHPRQIAPLREAFRPSEAEIEWAYKALETGDGVIAIDGLMIDEPVRVRARAILARSS